MTTHHPYRLDLTKLTPWQRMQRACCSVIAAARQWATPSFVPTARQDDASPAEYENQNLCLQALRNVRMNNMAVHYSSRSEEWETPPSFFEELDNIFHFDLDACASLDNAKCERFFTKQDDALTQTWRGTVWMNPPYGRQIESFMRKAFMESCKGATVVCLVPCRTDTKWWHRYAKRGVVLQLQGRLRFGEAKTSAPFPSAIVIFFGGALGNALLPATLERLS